MSKQYALTVSVFEKAFFCAYTSEVHNGMIREIAIIIGNKMKCLLINQVNYNKYLSKSFFVVFRKFISIRIEIRFCIYNYTVYSIKFDDATNN